jgi:bacillithiol biosynthesis cysteine-adding enzyme BshC
MHIDQIPFSKTGIFNKLMLDYISAKESIQPFYNRPANITSIESQIKDRQRFEMDRKVLVNALNEQYTKLSEFNHQEEVKAQIDTLNNRNTFTVTTGHQLCLFSGPLYFIYKIANAINMAEMINKEHPEFHVVPVFWMASEDHDFEEINHVHFHGHKISWNTEESGAVGRMEVKNCLKALENLGFHFPNGERSKFLTSLFDTAYQHENLADATRYIVNELFGSKRLIIIDGDDHALKNQVAPYFKQELLKQTGQESVDESSNELRKLGYKTQVNARDINLFYLLDNYRDRITKTEDGFATSDGAYQFSEEEILSELENFPERFSPNVILRPLYQEVILPNLCYIGGGGELAYWLQLKSMFESFKVPFPILRLRNSLGVIPKNISRKIEKLDLEPVDLFTPYNELTTMLIKRNTAIDSNFKIQREAWNRTLNGWHNFVEELDSTLTSSVEAERARILNGLMRLEKKVVRNAKRHEGDKLRMLQEIKNELFPGNGLQERKDNFCKLYLMLGDDFVAQVLESIDPFANEFTLISE